MSRELGIPRSEITRDTRFGDDLGVDEFACFELLEAVEAGCGIRIPDHAVKRIETVADLERLVLRSHHDTGARNHTAQ